MERDLRIAVVLPRNMNFGPVGATAIDLCAYDYVQNSRYRQSIRTFIRPIDQPFADIDVVERSAPKRQMLFAIKTGFETAILKFRPDVILVEQHIPSAAAIKSSFPQTPVLLRRHGYIKSSKNPFRNYVLQSRLRKFSRVITVSDSVADNLIEQFPMLTKRTVTVHNGIDCSAWRSDKTKTNQIAFAGRAVPEKGGLEALEGTLQFLSQNPNWRLNFIFSTSDSNAKYVNDLLRMVDGYKANGSQIELNFDVSHDEVRRTFEESKIVIVPSVWNEPFGRTAIEAMSAGAMLITSATGGLAEIANHDNSYLLDVVSGEAILKALDQYNNEDEKLAVLAANGRKTAKEEFSIQAVTRKLDDVIAGVCLKPNLTLGSDANV